MASIVGNNCRLAAWWASGLVGICLALSSAPCWAVEGAAAAGPIGGSDIRSAILPSPGFYGGVVGLYNNVTQFHDGTGHPAPALNAVGLTDNIAGAFFLYVLDFKLFDGRIGLAGFVAGGQDCGQLVSAVPRRCTETGLGDPYFELSWSRSFGQLRPPTVTGAFPIVQGLVLDFGIGALLPIGNYNQQLQEMNGVTLGNNTFDLAPSMAVTYTTPPLIADGTEFSGTTTRPIPSRNITRASCSMSTLLSPSMSAAFRSGRPASTCSRPVRTGSSAQSFRRTAGGSNTWRLAASSTTTSPNTMPSSASRPTRRFFPKTVSWRNYSYSLLRRSCFSAAHQTTSEARIVKETRRLRSQIAPAWLRQSDRRP